MKLKLFVLGVVLALPLVGYVFYYASFVSVGKADTLPDWVTMAPLIYLALAATLLFYVARRLGIYRPPKPAPAKVATELRGYFRAQAIALVLV